MRLLRNLADLTEELRGGAVSIGNFDGVHLGHARIVAQLRAAAESVRGPSVVFTFDPHPARLLRPAEAPAPLTWTDRKAELLAELGVDAMIAYPTDEALLNLEPREFFDRIVRGSLNARALVEGPNFYFGRDRAGTIDVLRHLADASGISLAIAEPVVLDGQIVSSSRVRRALNEGQVDLARRMLTRPYRLRGMVTHGAGRGAKIGFPTANLEAVDTLMPGAGVYAAWAWIDGVRHSAAVNVGPNPTFGEHALKLEVHVLDFAAPLYGRAVEVDFLSRLRDIQPFAGVEALREQLARDVAAARRVAAEAAATKSATTLSPPRPTAAGDQTPAETHGN